MLRTSVDMFALRESAGAGGPKEVGAPENRIESLEANALTPRDENLLPGIWAGTELLRPHQYGERPGDGQVPGWAYLRITRVWQVFMAVMCPPPVAGPRLGVPPVECTTRITGQVGF